MVAKMIIAYMKVNAMKLLTKDVIKTTYAYYLLYTRKICHIKSPYIKSVDETIEDILNTQRSLIRFGDGEISIIRGFDIRFQKYSERLSNELVEALSENTDKLMIAIPDTMDLTALKQYKNGERKAWIKESIFSYPIYKKYCKNAYYYNSLVSRLYLPFNCDRSVTQKRFEKIKKVWAQKKVLIVEGRYSRLGVGNDLFDNVNFIHRIVCPEKNAFEYIDEIEERIKSAQESNKYDLIIVALGPTAKVIGLHLYNEMRILDLGHIDIEYEWYIKKAKKKIAVDGKYVNEVTDDKQNYEIKDERYNSQIIARIEES